MGIAAPLGALFVPADSHVQTPQIIPDQGQQPRLVPLEQGVENFAVFPQGDLKILGRHPSPAVNEKDTADAPVEFIQPSQLIVVGHLDQQQVEPSLKVPGFCQVGGGDVVELVYDFLQLCDQLRKLVHILNRRVNGPALHHDAGVEIVVDILRGKLLDDETPTRNSLHQSLRD